MSRVPPGDLNQNTLYWKWSCDISKLSSKFCDAPLAMLIRVFLDKDDIDNFAPGFVCSNLEVLSDHVNCVLSSRLGDAIRAWCEGSRDIQPEGRCSCQHSWLAVSFIKAFNIAKKKFEDQRESIRQNPQNQDFLKFSTEWKKVLSDLQLLIRTDPPKTRTEKDLKLALQLTLDVGWSESADILAGTGKGPHFVLGRKLAIQAGGILFDDYFAGYFDD